MSRITELMRLLSGGSGDEKARQLALHLAETARAFRQLAQKQTQVRRQRSRNRLLFIVDRVGEAQLDSVQGWRSSWRSQRVRAASGRP